MIKPSRSPRNSSSMVGLVERDADGRRLHTVDRHPHPRHPRERRAKDSRSRVPAGRAGLAGAERCDGARPEPRRDRVGRTRGYITLYPCASTCPLSAAINFTAGETKANLVDAMFRPDSVLCLWSNVDTHAVVDLQGFHSTSGSGRLVPRTAVRLVDTLSNGCLGCRPGPEDPGDR